MTTLHISLVGRTDLANEIYQQIKQAILERKLRSGDRLPSTRALAKDLSVSRSTVTAAYERLVGDGLAASRIGAATFVSYEARGSRHVAPRASKRATLRARSVWDSVVINAAFPDRMPFDFRLGIPEIGQFPHDAWRKAVLRAVRSDEMKSGMYESPAGLPALRESIADHIGVSRNVNVSADDVIVTSGTQQALDIVARVLLEPGDVVAIETPGYGPPRYLFKSLGARVMAVPVDIDGLVVDRLPATARMVYVTPSHQFPLGVTMSLPRRRALLAWAERHNAAIIEDDYDSEFRFGGRPLDPLQNLDVAGRVIYIGSFSKTILPALRIGFLVMPPSLRVAAQKAKHVSDWHSSTLVQSALAHFIADGSFARHLRKMTNLYGERREIICEAVVKSFGDHLELMPGNAGLHVAAVAKHASIEDIASVARQAAGFGVGVQELASFAAGAQPRAGITLAYGRVPTRRIAEGLRHLRACFG